MTDAELCAWMSDHGNSLSTLAGELGVHKRTVGRWRSGELPVPRMTELALQAITSVAADVESGRFTPDPDSPDWLIRARELAKIRVPGED
jgi:hypothetical protein